MDIEQDSEKAALNQKKSRPITDEDWAKIAEMMDRPFGIVSLKIDGYKITLQQENYKRRIFTAIYVDGSIRGEWYYPLEDNKPEAKHEEARRFWMPRTKRVHSAKSIKAIQKFNGKRKAKRCAELKHYYFEPYWKSAKSLRKHLETNNKEILVVDISFA